MEPPGQTTTELQHWLDLLKSGDEQGRTRLLDRACERLRKLARRMLRGYPLVRRWEQTGDVLNAAMLRLFRALLEVQPESLRHFFNLAAQQIRRELIDLARQHARLDGQTELTTEVAADRDEPGTLAQWTEFHAKVEGLPDEEREVFSLIWYEELTQAEVADLLKVSTRTVIRRWQNARFLLGGALYGHEPDAK
jgi:RNA polymerase sigma-70 factor (ECF subfamily)